MKKAVSVLITIAGVILIAIGAIPKLATFAANASSVAQSVSVIGGADGPTAIFIAGKMGTDFGGVSMIVGAVLTVIGVVMLVKENISRRK